MKVSNGKQNQLSVWILAIVVMLGVLPGILAQSPAGPVSEPGKAPPDLSGLWVPARVFNGRNFRFSLEDPPLQPWAMEIFKRNRAGVTDPREPAVDEVDPTTYCYPKGPTRVMVRYPFRIIQSPAIVALIIEINDGVRQIFVDGRPHPEGWPFGWMGHSIGKYEGDTLVVDTVGLNDRTWIDAGGTPHSDALHVVERFRRIRPDTLEIEFLFEDPKAFTRPWGAKKLYQLRPEMDVLEQIACEEYLQIGKHREVK